jgi:hypothetical protein
MVSFPSILTGPSLISTTQKAFLLSPSAPAPTFIAMEFIYQLFANNISEAEGCDDVPLGHNESGTGGGWNGGQCVVA